MNEGLSFGETMMASLTGAMTMLFAAVPKILGFIVILLIGWFIASLIAKGVAALLRGVKFDDMAQRAGFAGFVQAQPKLKEAANAARDSAHSSMEGPAGLPAVKRSPY